MKTKLEQLSLLLKTLSLLSNLSKGAMTLSRCYLLLNKFVIFVSFIKGSNDIVLLSPLIEQICDLCLFCQRKQ